MGAFLFFGGIKITTWKVGNGRYMDYCRQVIANA